MVRETAGFRSLCGLSVNEGYIDASERSFQCSQYTGRAPSLETTSRIRWEHRAAD